MELGHNVRMTELLLLTVNLPNLERPFLGGMALIEYEAQSVAVVFRRNWAGLCGEDDAEVFAEMEPTLQAIASQSGSAKEFLEQLEDRLSNVVRCLDRLRLPNTIPFPKQVALLQAALIDDDQPECHQLSETVVL